MTMSAASALHEVDGGPGGEAREGRELIAATRPFAEESRLRSWWHTLSTFAILGLCLWGAAALGAWPLRLGAAVIAGLVIVRAFILYHDFLHGALLRGSWLARPLFYAYGMYALTPPRVWKQTHNYHHAHTAKLVGSHIGSYAMVSTDMWKELTPRQRLLYRITRHPLNIAIGYLTIFLYGLCVSSFLRNPRKHWDSLLALVLHGAASAWIVSTWGLAVYAVVWLLPLCIAMASGAYLFYAQHNFPEADVRSREEWSYTHAALESSSYMRMGPIARWFTGNIGYHHVHHLNPTIPFYRLPEAMAGIPELQDPPTTSLHPREILACFRLKLWDPRLGRMVGYPDAA
jgi:acyl-lipid omega-6 desaturase (Delta-12 desaturase)